MLNNQGTMDKVSVIAEEVDGVGDKGSGDTTNSQCTDTLGDLYGGLPDLEIFSLTVKILYFQGMSIQIKGFPLYYCVMLHDSCLPFYRLASKHVFSYFKVL
jgi:hypothetical protein